MSRVVESPGTGFPHLRVAWPGHALRAGITTRAASAARDGERDPALATLRRWATGRFDGVVGSAQVHGARIYGTDPVAVPETGSREGPYLLRLAGYDGFLSGRPGTLLTVGVADCVPALLYAPETAAVALLHAGWRGVAAGILQAALDRLEAAGIRPQGVLAWWGPAVGRCCYPVGEEVVEAIRSTAAGRAPEAWLERAPDGARVDLRAALSVQAQARGVPGASITVSPHCTSCSGGLFFSHRREPEAGRMLAFAGVPLA